MKGNAVAEGLVPLLSIDEVAGHLGLHRKTVELMIRRGDLVPTRVGRRVMVRVDELQEFIDNHTEPVA